MPANTPTEKATGNTAYSSYRNTYTAADKKAGATTKEKGQTEISNKGNENPAEHRNPRQVFQQGNHTETVSERLQSRTDHCA